MIRQKANEKPDQSLTTGNHKKQEPFGDETRLAWSNRSCNIQNEAYKLCGDEDAKLKVNQ